MEILLFFLKQTDIYGHNLLYYLRMWVLLNLIYLDMIEEAYSLPRIKNLILK